MIRITADWDTTSEYVIRRHINKIFKYISVEKLEITKSNSKGYHAVVWTKMSLSKSKIFFLRELIGDDLSRIKMDKKRRHPKQYLFYKKIGL